MKVDPTARDEIQRILEQHGEVRTSQVLEAAENPDSALHSYFLWNDDLAGHQYRLNQARTLIKRVRITHQGREERLVHVKIQTEPKGEGYYKPLTVIVQNKTELSYALDEALGKLHAAQRSVEAIQNVVDGVGDTTAQQLVLAIKSLSVAESAMASIQH